MEDNVIRVGVTGATGLIGWHLRCCLGVQEGIRVRVVPKEAFRRTDLLEGVLAQCDCLVHLAGVNRGDSEEVERANIDLARRVVTALDHVGTAPQVIFSSSTHVAQSTAYGQSKRVGAELLGDWSVRAGAKFHNLVLPHIFGEHGKPFHNSVISTFCHQLACEGRPRVENDGELQLLHTFDLSKLILKSILNNTDGEHRPGGRCMKVSEALQSLQLLCESYFQGVIPSLEDSLDLALFNTLRSYLYPQYYPMQLQLKTDARGSLFEAIKTSHGGQAFTSTTKSGITRGDHFHFSKVERFVVLQGEAVIRLRRMYHDECVEFAVSGSEPSAVDIPTLHTHSITNTGDGDLVTLFWSHEIFDPKNADTHPEMVVEQEEA